MFEIYLKLFPIFATFALGFGLKKAKIFHSENGSLLLKILFYIVSPAMGYLSTSQLVMTPHLLVLPLMSFLTMSSIYLLNVLVTKTFAVSRKTLGVYMVGTLITNTGFALPFLITAYGIEAVAKVAMFDLAGGVLAYSFVYSLAVKHGNDQPNLKFILQKVLLSPPLWAVVLGLTANWANFHTPEILVGFLQSLTNTYTVLGMLALGLVFDPTIFQPKLVTLGLLTRMVGGLALGYLLATVFNLTGSDRVIAIICTSAPIGFNTLTFTDLEKLDGKFAASLVSLGLVAGFCLIPVLLLVLR
jgi:predicted permease